MIRIDRTTASLSLVSYFVNEFNDTYTQTLFFSANRTSLVPGHSCLQSGKDFYLEKAASLMGINAVLAKVNKMI